jgi:4-amino-4-deoxy-L-arabinose transferase-like glycosyltransferase
MIVEHKRFLYLMLAGATLLAAGLGLRDPWPPDEPRFALIAKDMVESGDWLIPRVGGVLYPDKPPLFFWLVGVFYALTESIRVAVLLPALLSGLGVLWLVHDLASRLWNPETAMWCGVALLATVQFPLQMKAGQIDGVLCFWTTLALYGLCRHLLLGPDWHWYAIAGLSSGLGVITKGVGFLPFFVFAPWVLALHRNWPMPGIRWSGGKWLLAPLAFALAIAIWLVPMLMVTSGAADPEFAQYRDDILLKQTVTRYADAWSHVKPPWYLFTNAVPWLWLPLTLLLPWLIPRWARDLQARQAATLLLGGWILLVLLFFSMSDGKRSLYIFPALPALALLAGRHLPAILARPWPRRLLLVLASLLAALPLAIGIFMLADYPPLHASLDEPANPIALAWISIATGLAATSVVGFCRPEGAARAFAGVMAILWLSTSLLIYPRIDATRSGRAIIDSASAALGPDSALAFAGWKEQLLLQWGKPAIHFGYRREDDDGESRDAASWLSGNETYRLLLPGELVGPCFDRSRLIELGFAHRRDWFLASGRSVLPQCRNKESPTIMVLYHPLEGGDQSLRTARRDREKARVEATFLP